jgi:hypothetical protein
MDITLSALRTNPGKYFNMARFGDVFVTRRGKRLGRIVAEAKKSKADKDQAFDLLYKIASSPSNHFNPSTDPDYNLIRETVYKEKGLLQ